MRETSGELTTPLLILAGGLATRLQGLAKDTPKYLQPIEGEVRFADVHLSWAKRQGFRRVFLSVGHLGEKIEAYCGDGRRYGLEISYLNDGAMPAGTGGAIRRALRLEFTEIAITYGDTFLAVPVRTFLKDFSVSGCEGAMTVYFNQVPGHVCNATLENGRVRYDKRSPRPEWRYIDYGFLALKRSVVERFPSSEPLDLATPLSELSRENKILGFEIKERFWEIGSPQALEEFRRVFRDDIKRLCDR